MAKVLKLDIEIDEHGSIKKIKDLETGISGAGKAAATTQGKFGGFSGALGTLKSMIMPILGAAGIYGLVSGLKDCISEGIKSEEIMKKLAMSVESTGGSFADSKPQIDSFLDSMMKTTRFGDEEMAASLTTLNLLTGDVSKSFTLAKLAADLAASGFGGLEEMSHTLGIAMGGNTERLQRQFPALRAMFDNLGKTATAAQKAEVAFKYLNERFGGAAQKDLTTFGGKLAQLRNYFGEVKEKIGLVIMEKLGPTIDKWRIALIDFVESGAAGKLAEQIATGLEKILGITQKTVALVEEYPKPTKWGLYAIAVGAAALAISALFKILSSTSNSLFLVATRLSKMARWFIEIPGKLTGTTWAFEKFRAVLRMAGEEFLVFDKGPIAFLKSLGGLFKKVGEAKPLILEIPKLFAEVITDTLARLGRFTKITPFWKELISDIKDATSALGKFGKTLESNVALKAAKALEEGLIPKGMTGATLKSWNEIVALINKATPWTEKLKSIFSDLSPVIKKITFPLIKILGKILLIVATVQSLYDIIIRLREAWAMITHPFKGFDVAVLGMKQSILEFHIWWQETWNKTLGKIFGEIPQKYTDQLYDQLYEVNTKIDSLYMKMGMVPKLPKIKEEEEVKIPAIDAALEIIKARKDAEQDAANAAIIVNEKAAEERKKIYDNMVAWEFGKNYESLQDYIKTLEEKGKKLEDYASIQTSIENALFAKDLVRSAEGLDKYVANLDAKIEAEENSGKKYSDIWLSLTKEKESAIKQQMDLEQGLTDFITGQEEERVKIITDQLEAGGEWYREMLNRKHDYEYEHNLLSAEEYIKFLEMRRDAEEKWSDNWINYQNKIDTANKNIIASGEEVGRFMQDLHVQILNTMISNIGSAKGFSDAMKNLTDQIIRAIAQMVIFKTIASVIGGPFGGFLPWHEGGEVKHQGGPIKGYQYGGAVDDILIRAQGGEYIEPRKSVNTQTIGELEYIRKTGGDRTNLF